MPTAIVLPILAATAWAARFLHSARFGLYADDPARVVPAIESSLAEIWRGFASSWVPLGAQGRPFHPFFISLFSNLGARLHGLEGIYWLAYLVFAGNVVLLYVLLSRVTRMPELAAIAALAYALFPADTTQAHLTMTFGGQTSVAFFLLGALAYSAGRRVPAYLLAFGSLTTYETVFPVFLAVPLLCLPWDRRLVKTMVVHAAVLGAMLTAIAVTRSAVHEEFVSQLHLVPALRRAVEQMAGGPATVLKTFTDRPVEGLRQQGAQHPWLLIGAAVSYGALLLWFFGARRREAPGADNWALLRVIGAGAAMLALAYPLTMTVSAWVTDGRATRVHLAAGIGTAVAFGGLATLALRVSPRPVRLGLLAALGMLFAGLVGFGLNVQADYVTSWRYQRSLWADLEKAIPDLEDGTIVLLDEAWLKDTAQAKSWGWYTPYVLRQRYRFPAEWTTPPLVYALRSDWRERLASGAPLLELLDFKWWHPEPMVNPKLVYVMPAYGKLNRMQDPITIGMGRLVLKRRGEPTAGSLPRGTYDDMLKLAPGEWLYYGVF